MVSVADGAEHDRRRCQRPQPLRLPPAAVVRCIMLRSLAAAVRSSAGAPGRSPYLARHARAMGFFFDDDDGGGGATAAAASAEKRWEEELYAIYSKHVLPIEKRYDYAKFATPSLQEADFLAPPMVMLLGQYSTGKTTMIEYLLGKPVPGSHKGPEPTTDKFVAVVAGGQGRTIPGHAAASDDEYPFKSLQRYGSSFLSKFEVAEVDSPILQNLMIIDTPGVLSGDKQSTDNRGYDFAAVTKHFAERADRILLLFDCSKLDISDEFREVVQSLEGQHDKVRCLLNKADQVGERELFRVYGALLWSLGKVAAQPEVWRVFVSSMWNGEYGNMANAELFDLEKAGLEDDLRSLPKNAKIRRINEFLKRWRAVKTHAVVCSELQTKFAYFGKEETQRTVLTGLNKAYSDFARRHSLNVADFCDAGKFRQVVRDLDLKMWEWDTTSAENLEHLDAEIMARVHELLENDDDETTAAAMEFHPENASAQPQNPDSERVAGGGGETGRT